MLDSLINFLLSVIDLFRFWVVIYDNEIGILLRFGKFTKYLNRGGGIFGSSLYLKFPFKIHDEKITHSSTDTILFHAKTNTLADAKTNITYTLGANYNIVDAKKFYIDTKDGDNSLVDSILMEAAGIICEYNPVDFLSHKYRSELEHKILEAARVQCDRYGIMLNRVKFAEFVINSRAYRLINGNS